MLRIEVVTADFRCWHFSDLTGWVDDVGSWGQNGQPAVRPRRPLMPLSETSCASCQRTAVRGERSGLNGFWDAWLTIDRGGKRTFGPFRCGVVAADTL
jgi:hypothetical protein